MVERKRLHLYEEVMLLALRDEEGTVATGYSEYVVAGALLAELLFDQRIEVENAGKQLVDLRTRKSTGDPILDECLGKMATSKRRASLQTWVSRLAGLKDLRHKVARRLCDRGILRADKDKVLFLFSRRIYPEMDPFPEKKIVERLKEAIFTNRGEIAPRTVVLISLANGTGLLDQTFGRKSIRSRRKRIEQIVNGELTGKATRQVIAACQSAALVAAIMPVIMTATIHN
jgi:hypothetical protein